VDTLVDVNRKTQHAQALARETSAATVKRHGVAGRATVSAPRVNDHRPRQSHIVRQRFVSAWACNRDAASSRKAAR
jgi:hypothetical protein